MAKKRLRIWIKTDSLENPGISAYALPALKMLLNLGKMFPDVLFVCVPPPQS